MRSMLNWKAVLLLHTMSVFLWQEETAIKADDVSTENDMSQPAMETAAMPTTSGAKLTCRKRRPQSNCDLETQLSKSMECVQQPVKCCMEKNSVSDDDDDVFGKLVAYECKKIKNTRIKRTLKKRITDMLFEAQEDDQQLQYIVVQSDQYIVEQ